jgi:hypothetical protein
MTVSVETKDYPEAPASLNFYGVTTKGWNVQFTLRDADEMNLVMRFADFTKLLEEKYHVTPKAVGQQPQPAPADFKPAAAPLPATTSQPAPAVAPAAPAIVPAPATQANLLEYDAVKLMGSMYKGKPYWKVLGGQYSKFGVTVWPEVLEAAGIAMSTLDVSNENGYSLAGFKARYQMGPNEKGEMKPDKVYELVRV